MTEDNKEIENTEDQVRTARTEDNREVTQRVESWENPSNLPSPNPSKNPTRLWSWIWEV